MCACVSIAMYIKSVSLSLRMLLKRFLNYEYLAAVSLGALPCSRKEHFGWHTTNRRTRTEYIFGKLLLRMKISCWFCVDCTINRRGVIFSCQSIKMMRSHRKHAGAATGKCITRKLGHIKANIGQILIEQQNWYINYSCAFQPNGNFVRSVDGVFRTKKPMPNAK